MSTRRNIFDNRDIYGNEPEEPATESSEDEMDEPESDEESEFEEEEGEDDETEQPRATARKDHVNTELEHKVHHVFDALEDVDLKLFDFLESITWNHDTLPIDTRQARIRNQRTSLLSHERLRDMLQKWAHPPRSPHSRKSRPKGASHIFKPLAIDLVKDYTFREMNKLAPFLSLGTTDDIREESLTRLSFEQMEQKIKEDAPTIWSILDTLVRRKKARVCPVKKKPEKMITTIVSMLAYTRSHRQCRLQKIFAIYFNFKGVSAKGFDTLHALGITMSHKWTADAVERISKQCILEVIRKIHQFPWLLTYDNVNIPFRVSENK